jgi:protein-tyrosine phosphatase
MITRIWHRLSVGSLEDARQLSSANPLGIQIVLSLCPEEVLPHGKGITFIRHPISDSTPISSKQFDQIMASIANSIRSGGVLLRCAAGLSRSPIICAAWMHRCGYASIDAALAEIEALRTIDPSPVLLSSVRNILQ